MSFFLFKVMDIINCNIFLTFRHYLNIEIFKMTFPHSDDGKKPFEVHSTVEFAKQHDMSLEIIHGDVLETGGPTLMERKVNLGKGAMVKALTRTIRQGKRTINGMSGEEKLVKWGGNKYMFF